MEFKRRFYLLNIGAKPEPPWGSVEQEYSREPLCKNYLPLVPKDVIECYPSPQKNTLWHKDYFKLKATE
jgi:hypothetical protein